MKRFRAAEAARMAKAPQEIDKLLAVGVSPADSKLNQVDIAAMTLVAAGVMNSPDAYTLR